MVKKVMRKAGGGMAKGPGPDARGVSSKDAADKFNPRMLTKDYERPRPTGPGPNRLGMPASNLYRGAGGDGDGRFGKPGGLENMPRVIGKPNATMPMRRAKGGAADKANWIQDAIKKPGALRSSLGAKKGEPIPMGKLEKAASSKNPKMAKRANLAMTLRGMKKK